MKYGNIKTIIFWGLFFIILLFFEPVLTQQIPVQEGQVYVCPLATKIEEINPRCECRIDLVLGETVTSTCPKNGQSYEMTLNITEYEGKEYYAIYGFENGGAGVNFAPQAKITGKFNGVVGETLNFSGADSSDPNDDPLDFYWDFGDENSAYGENVVHTYNLPGKYILKLSVSDGIASSTATATIIIKEKESYFQNISFSLPRFSPTKEKEEKEEKTKEKEDEKPAEKPIKFLATKEPQTLPREKAKPEREEEVKKERFSLNEKVLPPKSGKIFLASLVEISKEKLIVFVFAILIILGILKARGTLFSKGKK